MSGLAGVRANGRLVSGINAELAEKRYPRCRYSARYQMECPLRLVGTTLQVSHPARAWGAALVFYRDLLPVRRECEHMFVTSDGSAYARFRRALETGNELLVLAAARELPQVSLADALGVVLLFRDGEPERYERACVRWLGRFALEARGVTIEALRAAADALDALPERASEGMERLQALCVAHGIS